jgi:hypothetical protein
LFQGKDDNQMRLAAQKNAVCLLFFALWFPQCCRSGAVPNVSFNASISFALGGEEIVFPGDKSATGGNHAVDRIKYVAYSVIALVIVAMGIVGNLFNLMVLTRPHLKGVMYVYLLGLAASNLCVLVSAIPALLGLSGDLAGQDYLTAFYQAHLALPLINAFMASSVYIIICMTVNRYISIHHPTQFKMFHTELKAKLSIAVSFLGGMLLHLPLCFQNKVVCSASGSSSSLDDQLPPSLPMVAQRNMSLVTETLLSLFAANTTAEHELLLPPSPPCLSLEDETVTESHTFKIYLVVSEILLRFGPILILAVLNTLIIIRFKKLARKKAALRGGKRPVLMRSSTLPAPLPDGVSTSGGGTARLQVAGSFAKKPSASLSSLVLKANLGAAVMADMVSGEATVPRTVEEEEEGEGEEEVEPVLAPKRLSYQGSEERVLVVLLVSLVVLFVCCTTPAAILSILYSVKLNQHLGFQVFRAVANNLELLNFALNFYIYCLCSAEIRNAFTFLFWNICSAVRRNKIKKTSFV